MRQGERIGAEGAVFLNCSGYSLFYTNPDDIVRVSDYHSPHCLLMVNNNLGDSYRDSIKEVTQQLEELAASAKRRGDENNPYFYLKTDPGGQLMFTNPRIYRSFHNPNVRYRTIEVHATRSYKVPDISTSLFRDHGYHTAEFDIPYRERAMLDLQGDGRIWILDTGGKPVELKVFAYDIETSKYDINQITMVGWAEFTITYRAERKPDGSCDFEILHLPDWKEVDIEQVVMPNLADELDVLINLLYMFDRNHIIVGHNIMAFDNKQVIDRLKWFIEEEHDEFAKRPADEQKFVKQFIRSKTKQGNIFFYGDMQDTIDIYPLSFDTYYAAKLLYKFLPAFNLKFLAQNFNFDVKEVEGRERIYLDANSISIDTPEETEMTLAYNKDDVREQIALTIQLIGDAMRLSHLTGMAFNDILPAGTTKVWDYMSHMRAHIGRRIMPSIVPAAKMCEEIFHKFGSYDGTKPWTKKTLTDRARKAMNQPDAPSDKLLKLMKYGYEAPDYILYPHLIYNPYHKNTVHITTDLKCQCKECNEAMQRRPVNLKLCRCKFCNDLRRKFPGGFPIKGSRQAHVDFMVDELRGHGHEEPMDELERMVVNSKGFREFNIGYHFPGGMTLHPDWDDVRSHFKIWWNIIIADVGAMYPANLRAENIGGDTTRWADPRHYEIDGITLRPKSSSPYRLAKETYRWVWLRRIRQDIISNFMVGIHHEELHGSEQYKELSKEYSFVREGYLVAVVIDDDPGGVSQAMRAVLDVTGMLKELKFQMAKPDSGASDLEKSQIKNAYQSMKALRNSGSVDGSRELLLMDPLDNYTRLRADELFDMFDADVYTDDRGDVLFEVKDVESFGWKAVAVNDAGTVCVRPLKKVMRHYYAGDMVYVRTVIGETIVTPNHSIYDIGKGSIHKIEAGNEPERAVSVVSLPNRQVDTVIDWLDMIDDTPFFVFMKDCFDWPDYIPRTDVKRNVSYSSHRSGHYIKWKLEDCPEIDRLSDSQKDDLRIGKTGKSMIPCRVTIDEELARLLGYYAAEGWINAYERATSVSHSVSLCSADEEMLDYYCSIMERRFELPTYKVKRNDERRDSTFFQASWYCEPLAYLFEILVGRSCENKTVPDIIINASDDVKKAFICGVIDGDGYATEDRCSRPVRSIRKHPSKAYSDYTYWQIASNSFSLLFGIRIMLAQLGATCGLNYDKQGGGQLYNIAERPYRSRVLNDVISNPVREASMHHPSGTYVYDLEVGGVHNYLDSSLMLLENTHGILTSPNVSCRQFCLAGGARITTLGQLVLNDCLDNFDKVNARKIYGDSVTGGRQIRIRFGDLVRSATFDELWDYLSSMFTVEVRGHNEYIQLNGTYEVETFNINTKKVEWGKVDYITRHPYDGNTVRIVVGEGNRVCSTEVTTQHSVFDVKGREIDAGELTVGSRVLVMSKDRSSAVSGEVRALTLGSTTGPVYDLSVRGTPRFFDAEGVALHNTDGIYTACSKDAASVELVKALFELDQAGEDFVPPENVEQTVKLINSKWQAILSYPDYALDIEDHHGMMLVKHKNYMTFDVIKDKETGKPIEMKIGFKGNNFKSSDKPPVVMDQLKEIMLEVVRENCLWHDEEEEFVRVRSDIKTKARTKIEALPIEDVPMKKLSFTQKVRPRSTYAEGEKECPACDGMGCEYCDDTGKKLSIFAARSGAFRRLFYSENPFVSTISVKCVVCNNPLPYIYKPSKSASKPLAYMWPIEAIEESDEAREMSGGIDYDWYKAACFAYIKGAFDFDDWANEPWICKSMQRTLDGNVKLSVALRTKPKSVKHLMVPGNSRFMKLIKEGEAVEDEIIERLDPF